jgi:nicotinamidase-related amidase
MRKITTFLLPVLFFILPSCASFSLEITDPARVAGKVLAARDMNEEGLALDLIWETGGNRGGWRMNRAGVTIDPGRTVLIICDMWDRHWSRGATERVNVLAPRINRLAARLRDLGVLVIHAPSNTMPYYEEHPARRRLLSVKPEADEITKRVPRFPLPIDDSDGGSDTGESGDQVNRAVWSKQHDAIVIDEARDLIGEEGDLIRSYLRQDRRDLVLVAGVHTNMCVLNRDFAILSMLEHGFDCLLLEDYTDAMYNPEMPPYVSHDEGTRLVISHIRRYYCPSALVP